MGDIKTINPGQPVMGPYSPAAAAGNYLFLSGQIPKDAAGKMIGDTIENATKQVLENVKTVLAAGGCGFTDVVKCTVFMQDLNDFDGMNKIYASYFGDHRPARSTVQVAKLPAGARVEIECIAYKK